MADNKIELKSIGELLDYHFYIPSYQRGYRWTEQQVKDLLDDINEFQKNGADGIYCIQPLVVKKNRLNANQIVQEIHNENELAKIEDTLQKANLRWDVIDGQQRLTTIFILLSYLDNSRKYSLEYQTREKSADFLSHMSQEVAQTNIDFFHMYKSSEIICKWFEEHKNEKGEIVPPDKNTFLNVLLKKVKFIWYETSEVNPIKVFTRLNIGKIALTDAELIKALFLNSFNFKSENEEKICLQQIEIASEWDRIEYVLQDEELWLFLNDIGYSKPTRIDFIFDLMKDKDVFGLKKLLKNYDEAIGNDEHQTFRYFYEYFRLARYNKQINAKWLKTTWQKVKLYYQIFEEWYNDMKLYHYVGYLITLGEKASTLIDDYRECSSRNEFEKKLKELIKGKIDACKDLNRSYGENGEKKTECRPLLLLFNIQTVINQNLELAKNPEYGLGAFYKFPFHLFKKEGNKRNHKGWEVEHIASNSGDKLEDDKSNQKTWLASVAYSLPENDHLRNDIKLFLSGNKEIKFCDLCDQVKKLDINPLTGEDKQKVWNYTLLDSSTNEEYQNNPFPIKRICVLSKDQGHKATVSFIKQFKINKSTTSIAFVPPCTKNVFVKAYTDVPKSLSAWSKDDAEHYRDAIYDTLEKFGVTK